MSQARSSVLSPAAGSAWETFKARIAASGERVLRELESCWSDLQQVVELQLAAAEAVECLPEGLSLEDVRSRRQAFFKAAFGDPMQRFHRLHPQRRSLLAAETFDRSLEELVRCLPASASMTPAELQAWLGVAAGGGGWVRSIQEEPKTGDPPVGAGTTRGLVHPPGPG